VEREQAEREQAEREQAEREQVEREQAEREQAEEVPGTRLTESVEARGVVGAASPDRPQGMDHRACTEHMAASWAHHWCSARILRGGCAMLDCQL